jgi:hypothetical protein
MFGRTMTGMTVTLHDGPLADEVAIIFCVASRGRINARAWRFEC